MSSHAMVFIDDANKPANIPGCETIITQCFDLGPRQATAINVSGVRIALDKRSDHDVSDIWVKFGCGIRMSEARTQRYVAQYLRDKNNPAVRAPCVYYAFTWSDFGYIITEYIDGRMCDNSDIALVAAAVQALIVIPSPEVKPRPGPVGGGPIEHPFFFNRRSSIEYESVEELEDHINGILSVTERSGRVSLCEELAEHGLLLCVSDLKRVNFMRDRDDRIVAVDFGGYSFLPPSFLGFALTDGNFAHRVGTMLKFPLSPTNVGALVSASCALAPYSSNDVGVPRRLRSRRQYY